MAVKEEIRELTLRQREGRAINAVAELLRRKLSVPNIYLEPPSSLISADVLAVDHGGAGDLHAVEIKLESDIDSSHIQLWESSNPKEPKQLEWIAKFGEKIHRIHHQLMSMPAHYRYLAIPVRSFGLVFGELGRFGLFPEDGIGRLGIILLTDRGGESPAAEMSVVPERFRMDPAKLKTIETKLLAKNRPDIEVRI
ncbi:MAG: hypothetical protein ABSG96_15545 [Terracidiphilus sp.]|jgi:hypothetical protein